MTNPDTPYFSARDAKTKFGELLDTAMGRPVGITKHERLCAYVMSKYHYESMLVLVQTLQDKISLLEAESAKKEGFVPTEDVMEFFNSTDGAPKK